MRVLLDRPASVTVGKGVGHHGAARCPTPTTPSCPRRLSTGTRTFSASTLPRITRHHPRDQRALLQRKRGSSARANWEKIGRMSAISRRAESAWRTSAVVGSLHGQRCFEAPLRNSEELRVSRTSTTCIPTSFTNVTNGIAHRRWLCYANPRLASLVKERIGDGYRQAARRARGAAARIGTTTDTLRAPWRRSSSANKADFSNYVYGATGINARPRVRFSTCRSSVCTSTSGSFSTRCTSSTCTLALRENPAPRDACRTPSSSARRPRPGTIWQRTSSASSATLSADDRKAIPNIAGKLKVVFPRKLQRHARRAPHPRRPTSASRFRSPARRPAARAI